MTRRWFIRILFLIPLLACLAAWTWSYWGDTPLVGYTHTSEPDCQYMAKLHRGTLHLCTSDWCQNYPIGLFCDRTIWEPPPASESRTLGFYLDDNSDGFFHWCGVPLWFPTLLSAAILVFIWRKTPQPKPGGAFPVELTKTNTP